MTGQIYLQRKQGYVVFNGVAMYVQHLGRRREWFSEEVQQFATFILHIQCKITKADTAKCQRVMGKNEPECSLAVFLNWDILSPQGTLGDVWRHF